MVQESTAIGSLRQALSLVHESKSKAISVPSHETINLCDQVGLQLALAFLHKTRTVTV